MCRLLHSSNKHQLYAILLLVLSLLVNTNYLVAQVTIGSLSKPAEDALLDLKENSVTTKGLGLPRVALQNINSLKMGENAPAFDSENDKKQYTGLLVYHVNDKDECDPKFVGKSGIYVWGENRWIPIGANEHKDYEHNYGDPIYQTNTYMIEGKGETVKCG